jgi:hypothetical protein
MNTVIVWVLMTFSGYQSGVRYSPPVATREACEVMRTATAQWRTEAVCVKVEIVK